MSGVAESADLDNVKVVGYKLYEKIALLTEVKTVMQAAVTQVT